MESYLNLFVKSIFVENMIFAYFLGMCSYLAVSKTVKTAVGLGFAVIFVLAITVPINFLLDTYLLRPGALSWFDKSYADLDLSFLSFIMFMTIIYKKEEFEKRNQYYFLIMMLKTLKK